MESSEPLPVWDCLSKSSLLKINTGTHFNVPQFIFSQEEFNRFLIHESLDFHITGKSGIKPPDFHHHNLPIKQIVPEL